MSKDTTPHASMNSSTDHTEDTPGPSSTEPKREKLFSFVGNPVRQSTEVLQIQESINIEFQRYLSQPCISEDRDVLAYWKDHRETFPTLAKLAQKYLSVPASSAPVERIFSIAGKVFRPDRCRLTDKNFESVMFVKCNDKSYK